MSTPPERRSRFRRPFRSAASRGTAGFNAVVRAPLSGVPGPFRVRGRAAGLDDIATPAQERGMRSFWWDGFWASSSETIIVNYAGLFVLALGANTSQVGLLASLSSLAAALAFIPGARLVEAIGRPKSIVVWTGGGVARATLLAVALVPFFAHGDVAVWIVIGLISFRGFWGYFAVPAWTQLTADVVPLGIRGRFLASRNFGSSLAALLTAPLAGFLIDRYGGLHGWQLVWVVAFATGAIATWCYARIPEPQHAAHTAASVSTPAPAENSARATERNFVSDILADRNFVMYLVSVAVWNVALQSAGPFFNVYLAEHLHASSAMIGFLASVMSITGLLGLYFGRVMDERGTKWLMVASGLLIPLLPAAWLFVTSAWQVILINGPAGILWAGYQLAALNIVMIMAPAAKRARYAAAFQTVTFAGAFAGPLLGGSIIAAFGFRGVFVFSSIGRMAGTLLLWRFVSVAESRRGATTP